MLMNFKSINVNQSVKRNRSGGGRPFHSRLEPLVEFIREQRQQRRTWQEIATRLRTEKDCVITSQGLHQFYRRYLKRQSRPHWESEALTALPTMVKPQSAARKPVLAITPKPLSYRQPNPDSINLNDPSKI
jgi:hypothetical protein